MNFWLRNQPGIWLLGALIVLLGTEINPTAGLPSIVSPNGIIQGTKATSRDGKAYFAFRGIQYAKVPGRFQSSLLVEQWEEPIKADHYGPSCPKIGMVDGSLHVGSEDCLYLNVYVAETNDLELLPVLVWIHGGGFLDGSGADHSPEFFMDEKVILVTLNYRLGVFGFLSTADSVAQGNNGLRDMVNALKWIQRNIHAFGGDAGKVTIFGESAGGVAVHLLMLSPAAKGLIHGVISQSGNGFCPWGLNITPVKWARMLGSATNCDNSNSQKLVSCLKTRSVEEILQATKTLMFNGGATELPFAPTIEFFPSGKPADFVIIPDLPYNLLRNYRDTSREVPLIIGQNEMEGINLFARPFLTDDEQLDKLDGNWAEITARPFFYENYVPKEKREEFGESLRSVYFRDEPLTSENKERLIKLHTEFFFIRGAKLALEHHAEMGTPVYPYVFKYRGRFGLGQGVIRDGGPTHADELQYLLPSVITPQNWPDLQPGSKEEEFSRKFVKLWCSFAINGKPTTSWADAWTAAEEVRAGDKEHAWLHLDDTPTMVDDTETMDRVNQLDQLYSPYEQPQLSWRAGKKGTIAKEEL